MIVKRNLPILISVILIAAVFLFTANYFSNKKTEGQSITVNPTVSESPVVIPPAHSKNIEVLSPRMGDSVTSGFRVTGNARVFESVVSIRLLDSEGNLLIETNTLANAPDVGQFGPFEKELRFQTDTQTGTLEVFQYSAKDGSEIDKVEVPVLFNE